MITAITRGWKLGRNDIAGLGVGTRGYWERVKKLGRCGSRPSSGRGGATGILYPLPPWEASRVGIDAKSGWTLVRTDVSQCRHAGSGGREHQPQQGGHAASMDRQQCKGEHRVPG